ncbi:MAG: hypothetical protein LQ338_000342 [Usnochroma carphineum]|nr:MAG: hypothetical protein LQ338_000342 [Usnochroma carphineum]
MALPIPRIHFYEITDQSWFPPFLREKVQAALTLLWVKCFPPFQSHSPASIVANTLQSILGPSIKNYTFIDFCSGAGGPTPQFEREINRSLELQAIQKYHAAQANRNAARRNYVNATSKENGALISTISADDDDTDPSVDFILTDLFPHIPSWKLACSRSHHLHYIPQPVDACSTPPNLLSLAHANPRSHQPAKTRKPFHLFSLAFHHFPDPLARLVLKDALTTSSGFAILELEDRSWGSLFIVLMTGPILWLTSWYYFWGDWTQLFFTYVLPVVPLVVVLDGFVSCMRTRTRGEILRLMDEIEGMEEGWRVGWRFESGKRSHTWPTGVATWFVGVKDR